MKPAHLVATVFKVIILNIIILTVVAFAFNMWRIFDTQKKVNSIGTAMSAEVSRNNTLMAETLDDFAEELREVQVKSGGRFVLQNVQLIVPTGETSSNEVEIITNNATGTVPDYTVYNNADFEHDATILQQYYTEAQGKYGDFVTVRLNYDIYIPLAAPRKAVDSEELDIKHEFDENEDMIATFTLHTDTSFDYTAPCLRYLK